MSKIKINKSEEVTNRLPFIPYPQFGNMCPGYLVGVEVVESEVSDTAKGEYAGRTIPRLSFHFVEHKLNAKEPDRFFTHTEFPINHTKVNGELVTEKNLGIMYMEMWRRIKHIHDQFATNPNYKALSGELEFDLDADVDDRIKEFKKFFTDMAKAFNVGKDKENPIYSNKDLLLLKLVASGKKLSYLAFPTFVGTGFIERVNINAGRIKTVLTFRPSETVELGTTSASASGVTAPASDELPSDLAAQLGVS